MADTDSIDLAKLDRAVTDNGVSMDAYSVLRVHVDRLRAERDALQEQVDSAGRIRQADLAFARVTTSQRDHAWAESARRKAERDAALAQVEAVRALTETVHGHGADTLHQECDRLRDIIALAAFAAGGTPPH